MNLQAALQTEEIRKHAESLVHQHIYRQVQKALGNDGVSGHIKRALPVGEWGDHPPQAILDSLLESRKGVECALVQLRNQCAACEIPLQEDGQVVSKEELAKALKSLVEIIDSAGLSNLSNGVQLGQMSWHVKASERLDWARTLINQPTANCQPLTEASP